MADKDQERGKTDDREVSKQHLTSLFYFNYMLITWAPIGSNYRIQGHILRSWTGSGSVASLSWQVFKERERYKTYK